MSENENISTEVATVSTSDAMSQLDQLRTGVGIFSTVQGTDFESKKRTLAAVTNAEPLSEHLNETINLVDMVGQMVIVNDEEGGETEALRIILIDDNGSAYAAISKGLSGSLRDIFGILGQPHTWDAPLPIQVVEVRGRSGFRFMKAQIA